MTCAWLSCVSVSRGSDSFRQEKSTNVVVEHVASHYYLSLFSEKVISVSPNPGSNQIQSHRSHNDSLPQRLNACPLFKHSERITIYWYKSNMEEQGEYRGMPVVLNFTESDCFLKCCQKDQRVFLQAEVSVAQQQNLPPPPLTFPTLLRFGDACGLQMARGEYFYFHSLVIFFLALTVTVADMFSDLQWDLKWRW